MRFDVTATGTRPLLMHNVRLADPLDPYAKGMAAINAKRKKTDEDRQDVARIEFEGGIYHDPVLGPYIPQEMLFASLYAAAKLDKLGELFKQAFLAFTEARYPLAYVGPRDVAKLREDANFTDRRSVGVQRNKVMRVRPRFQQWELDFAVELDTSILDPAQCESIIRKAGRYKGIGDYRDLFGRFDVRVTQSESEA
jgi:hypothetical protein